MSVRRIPLPLQHLKARRTRVTTRVGPLQTNPRRARPLHPASLRLDSLEATAVASRRPRPARPWAWKLHRQWGIADGERESLFL